MSNVLDRCRSFGDIAASVWVLQMTDEHDLSGMEKEKAEVERLLGGSDFCLFAVQTADWDSELPPWDAPPVFGNRAFRGGAAKTLETVEREIIPALEEAYGAREDRKWVIAGYSLAGLFALWCGYESDRFEAVMGASPSVWYPGWVEYARKHEPKAKAVYLSLGDREEKTRNQVMSRVGDAIREQEAILSERGVPAVLEWNEGNHFRDSELRCAKGIVWCLQTLRG